MGGGQGSIKLLPQSRPFLIQGSIAIANGPETLFKFALVQFGQIPQQRLVVGELIPRRLQFFQGREIVVLVFHVYFAVIHYLRSSQFGKPQLCESNP
jgi:hypothetical protein